MTYLTESFDEARLDEHHLVAADTDGCAERDELWINAPVRYPSPAQDQEQAQIKSGMSKHGSEEHLGIHQGVRHDPEVARGSSARGPRTSSLEGT